LGKKSDEKLGEKSDKNFMIMFAPALGIVSGSALGILTGLFTGNDLIISAGAGAGFGIIIGAAVSAYCNKKAKS